MDGKIKLFQFVQNGYQIMGIYPSQSNRNVLLNAKNVYFSLTMIEMIISSMAFFVFQAESIEEFGQSFFVSITILYALVGLLITIWKIPNILMLIEHFDEFVGKRECGIFVAIEFAPSQILKLILGAEQNSIAKTIYTEVNEKIERTTVNINFCLLKVSTTVSNVGSIITTEVNYFVHNMGDDSFELTLPQM